MSNKTFPWAMLGLAISAPLIHAATFQVSEDSYASSPAEMNPNSGKSPLLEISPQRPAYVRFDVADFAGQIPAANVTAARLTFYIAGSQAAGRLGIHRVTSEWTENPSGKRKLPSFSEKPLATLPAPSLREGQFAVIDVTEQVRQWLASPDKDLGLAIVSDGKAVCQIPSKEGPEKGLSATLEIDHQPRVGDSVISKGVNANKLGNGSVSNTEFASLNGVKSPVQGQLDKIAQDLLTVMNTTRDMGMEVNESSSEIDYLFDNLGSLSGSAYRLNSELNYLSGRLENQSIGFSAVLNTKVSRLGDTMTGSLGLPANGLKVGTNQLTVTAGKVGIGTDTPTAALEVRGDVKLGATGNLQATAAEETLRIVRGTILLNNDGTASLVSGSGFTFIKSGTRDVIINFTQPFASTPTITCEMELPPSATGIPMGYSLRSVSITGATVDDALDSAIKSFHFIAIGPR